VVGTGQALPGQSGRGLGSIKAQQRGGGRAASRGSSRGTGTGGRGGQSTQKGPHGGTIDSTGHERATAQTGPIGSTKLKQPSNASFEEAHPRGEPGTSQGGRFVAKGDSGEQVRNTQMALNQAHLQDKKLKEDGQFGVKTAAVVRHFQKAAGLQVDGIVGPKTSAALRERLNKPKRPKSNTRF